MGVRHVDSAADARRLAADLSSTARDKPYVVVSTPAQRLKPYVDVDDIFSAVGDLAEVYLIHTGADSWAFSKAMPEMTQVYGGAGRVYPVGTAWVSDPYLSPLRFAWNPAEGATATDRLVADALRMAAEAGLLRRPAAEPVRVAGEVKGIYPPSRALVRTDDRHHASIWQELLVPDVPVDRVLREGMPVQGSLDLATMRYDVREMLLPAAEGLAHYAVGEVVLAEVACVDADQAVLRLHPDVRVTVHRENVTSNDLDLVSSLMTRGEVLPARVTSLGPGWMLSLLDVDDDEEPLPPPSLLRGGPPWLSAQVPETREEVGPEVPLLVEQDTDAEMVDGAIEAAPTPAAAPPSTTALPTATPGQGAPLVPRQAAPSPAMFDRKRAAEAAARDAETTALRHELEEAVSALEKSEHERGAVLRAMVDLRNERLLLHNELERAKAENRRLSEQLSTSRTDLRKARQRAERVDRAERGRQRLFLDPEEEFRHDVHVAWAERIPATDKARRPLPAYHVGPDFLRTVDALEGVSYGKILDVVVEVLTRFADGLDGRELHPLRTSEAPGAPSVIRDDGAMSWRVALQTNTPQARRMHVWRLTNGEIELSRVGLHDDFTP